LHKRGNQFIKVFTTGEIIHLKSVVGLPITDSFAIGPGVAHFITIIAVEVFTLWWPPPVRLVLVGLPLPLVLIGFGGTWIPLYITTQEYQS
jgi:hypothetical protein